MSGRVSGQLYQPASSAASRAELVWQIDGGILLYAEGKAPETIDPATISISSRLGDTPRFISFADGRRFQSDDNDSIDRLQQQLPNKPGHWCGSLLHQLESRMRFVLPALVLTIGFVWLLVSYGLPFAARELAMRMPISVSVGLSEQIVRQMDSRLLKESELSPQQQEQLRKRFNQVVEWTDQPYPFSLNFRKGGERLAANAFALPSGFIVMTDELVALAKDEEELVAIMAHEIGHVVHRHGLRQVIQQSALGLVYTWLSGDFSSVVGALPLVLLQLGYSRDFEQEADQFTLQYLESQGIAPKHFANILLRLSEHYGSENNGKIDYYLSTHPPTRERIKDFL